MLRGLALEVLNLKRCCSRDRSNNHGEQDDGGRVDVSMSRMAVARGSVSMSRIVPYHDRLCARGVRLQGKAESAAQPANVWGSQSVGERSMGPLRATVITGLSRDRVIVVQGCARVLSGLCRGFEGVCVFFADCARIVHSLR